MSHVLLNLLNELRKRDKMQGLPIIFFSQLVNKFNNTGAWMLGCIYNMTSELLKNHIFGVKKVKNFPFFTQHYKEHHHVTILYL